MRGWYNISFLASCFGVGFSGADGSATGVLPLAWCVVLCISWCALFGGFPGAGCLCVYLEWA